MALTFISARKIFALRLFAKNRDDKTLNELRNMMAAVSRSQAVIQFDLDGVILEANQNFLSVVGYELSEIVGRHHKIFVDPPEAQTPAYAELW